MSVNPGERELTVYALDGFSVYRNGEAIPPAAWSRPKITALFHYFLVHRRTCIPQSALLDLFWPELEPAAARHNLAVSLYELRRILEPRRPPGAPPRFILTRGNLYTFDPGPGFWFDVDEFIELCQEARHLAQRNAWAEATALLPEILNLYRRDFLYGNNSYGFIITERYRLQQMFVNTVWLFAEHCFAHAAYARAAQLCEKILEIDTSWEQAARLLIRCFGKQGQRSTAARWFKSYAAYLQAQYGCPPDPVTTKVYEEVVGRKHGAQ